MQLTLNDEQRAIQESAHDFLAANAGLERLREVVDSGTGHDDRLWTSLAGEMGYAGLMVPEAYGGIGLGATEMALVLEETGGVLAVTPFFETAVLGAQLILSTGHESQKQALLPDLAAGRIRTSLAMTGETGRPCPEEISVTLERRPTNWRLHGQASFVTFAHVADWLLVIARAPGTSGAGAGALSVVAVPRDTPGVSIECVPGLDPTRPFSRVTFEQVEVPEDHILGEPEAAGTAVRRTLAIAAGLLAAEQTGGAAFCLSSTVDYAKQRVQFGRAIGSFQAVKHDLADMMVEVEAARSAVAYAAAAIEQAAIHLPNGGRANSALAAIDLPDGVRANSELASIDLPDRGRTDSELLEATSVARVWCTEAFRRCSAQAIQLHGGIGFTWEHHAHLYFKRARSSSTWLGDPAWHRERIARLIGLGQDHS